MASYNYTRFSAEEYDLNNFSGPGPGQKAPDFEVMNDAGFARRILDFDAPFLVLELGSITCPLFQSRRNGMAELKAQFPNVAHAVLYVREAHPGADIPAHGSMEQKISRARQLRDDNGEFREILIDGIAGGAHSGYGGYPNAVFIINRNGCVVYRSAWNNAGATRRVLKRLLSGKPVRSEGLFLPATPPVAIRTLRRAGKGAGIDFLRSLPKLVWKNLIRRNLLLLLGGGNRIRPDAVC